jgi:integrase
LQEAVDLDLIPRNNARGRCARLPRTTPKRRWLQIEHVIPMIDGAGPSRALMATLLLAGLRIGEALDLKWSAVDLAAGTLSVVKAKTDAGVRTVDLTPFLRRELTAHKLQSGFCQPDDLAFCTATGGRDDRHNVIKRVTHRAIRDANVVLAGRGLPLIPEDATNHDMRRVFFRLLGEVGAPPAYKDEQMGHKPQGLDGAYDRAFIRHRNLGERIDALVMGEPSEAEPIRNAI